MRKTAMLIVGLVVASAAFSASVSAESENPIQPWLKQTALLWGSGQISDAEFVAALQYLVAVGVLVIPEPEIVPFEPEPEEPQAIPARPGMHPDAVQGTITRIVDGDTLHFSGDTYRLSLIDTPERGEDGYSEATDALEELCPIGSTAYVEADSIQGLDRYGRYLGVVWCSGNDYATTAGEYLSDLGLLKKFYTNFCGSTEAATERWAEESGNWFYHSVCN